MEAALESIIAKLATKYRFSESSVDVEYSGEREYFEYFFFKFKYMKAKLLRKMHMLQAADEAC